MATSAKAPGSCRFGIDFDNTIVLYDRLLKDIAVRESLVPATIPAGKKPIRDAIRKLPSGEDQWIRVQGLLYGVHMLEADPAPGVFDFLMECRRLRIPVSVVSHKTRFPHVGPQVELRAVATEWLAVHGFFDGDEPLIRRESVFFEGTREEKIERIRERAVTHFIDDLEEVFLEPSFPESVARILYSAQSDPPADGGIQVLPTWERIRSHLLPETSRG